MLFYFLLPAVDVGDGGQNSSFCDDDDDAMTLLGLMEMQQTDAMNDTAKEGK